MSMNLSLIKSDLIDQIKRLAEKAADESYVLGKSEDVKKYKDQLELAIKQANEGCQFIQVVLNRLATMDDKIDDTTLRYIQCAKMELLKIEGVDE